MIRRKVDSTLTKVCFCCTVFGFSSLLSFLFLHLPLSFPALPSSHSNPLIPLHPSFPTLLSISLSLSLSLSPPCAVALLSPLSFIPICPFAQPSLHPHPPFAKRERDHLHQRTNRTDKIKRQSPFCLSSAQLVRSRQPQPEPQPRPEPILLIWPLSPTSSTRQHSSTQVTKTTTALFPSKTPSHTICTIHNPPLRFSILKTAILTTHFLLWVINYRAQGCAGGRWIPG